jgi:hypothetical protein
LVSPIDALWIINYLNTVGAGEGEEASACETRTPVHFVPTLTLTTAGIEGQSMDGQHSPRHLLISDASLCSPPWTGCPAAEFPQEAFWWAPDEGKWSDGDLEELLAELAADIESGWEASSRL